ncbi:MAG: thioredoxin domain-containing protein, partial [Nitriliruptoraceae bacterium]|nr:thioredoxin domain-containing protein [Nitriliruptoraceae bacterium]
GDDAPVLVDTSERETSSLDDPSDEASASPEDDRPSSARMAALRIDPDAGLSVGDPDAPMVMVAFESFGCLWCGVFHRETMPVVLEDWVDTGRLRIETRLQPYEPRAVPGARIAAAAAEQDLYWELAAHLYPFIAGTDEPPMGRDLTADELAAYQVRQSEEAMLRQAELVADEIGLDMDQLRADVADEATAAIVERDQQLAWQLGFTGTPAFVVNGVPQGGYSGPERFSAFLQAVYDASEG